MSLWAVVPVKPLHRSKTRLSSVLSAEARVELTCSLLDNMLQVLVASSEIEQVIVVSPDKKVGALAKEKGVLAFSKERPVNLNVAVTAASNQAYEHGATGVLVLPMDLPLFSTEALEALLAPAGDVLICPDEKFDGTNALVLRGVPNFEFCFGEDSFARHLKETTRHNKVAQTVFVDAIQFDLDTPADWQRYQKQQRVNA